MRAIPNREQLLKEHAASAPKTPDELYESILNAIVISVLNGAIHAGEQVYEKFGVAISLALEQRLRHAFDAAGFDLYFQVTRKGARCTRIYIERPPSPVV